MANDPGKKPVVHTKKHIARLERERRNSRLILYAFIAIVVIVVGLLGYGYLDIRYFQARRPVAKVGETEIIAADFESRVRLQRQQLLVQYSQMQYYQAFGMDVSAQVQQIETALNDSISIGQNVLNQMIDEEIIRQKAAELGITVSEEELNEMIQQTFQFFPNGTPTPTITPTDVILPTIPAEAFEIVTITPIPSETPLPTETPSASAPTEGTDSVTTGTPAPTNTSIPTATGTATYTPTATATEGPSPTPLPTSTPYTLEGFQSEFEKTVESLAKYDLTEEEYRSLFEIQLLREKLLEEVTKDVPRADEQLWARHILVADEAAAQDVLARLENGEDFAELAKELSLDTGSGANGGDLGWFGKGAMVAPFEEAAFSLQPGEISAPVQSDFGYHIIQLIARQDRPLTADQYAQARETAFNDFLTTAREELGVETYDDFWMSRVPTEPNFITAATESAAAANTAQAETAQAPEPTATP